MSCESCREHCAKCLVAVALRRLIAKAKGVDVHDCTEDQERAAKHLDIAIAMAEKALEGKP